MSEEELAAANLVIPKPEENATANPMNPEIELPPNGDDDLGGSQHNREGNNSSDGESSMGKTSDSNGEGDTAEGAEEEEGEDLDNVEADVNDLVAEVPTSCFFVILWLAKMISIFMLRKVISMLEIADH